MDKFLIKNTTRAEREKIVRDALGYGDIGCESDADGYDMYKPYIDGEMEIAEINMNHRSSF
ncbi:MAG: hypothetical protein K5986_03955 [Clostridium sp.]|uniref:hypothetical protein n=1 Tax=Clostridium sp. DSM 8431 TaxID=1761781 RepID=UPI0008E3DB10|nr:hypothetical protein [Clostridium sp. DSM 8431]MCR4943605.1 hypothetical protein [Clostridium sp.]SFU39250.1 hypothetical protein SAMN04487886_10183 [Clostridium sp. DSM 8431]